MRYDDKVFRTGTVHVTKRKNARIIINVPDDDEFIIIKFVHLSDKKIDNYSIVQGSLYGHCRRNVVSTYLRLTKGAFVALNVLSQQAIEENFSVFVANIKQGN